MVGAAFVGKLKTLSEYLASLMPEEQANTNAALLSALFKLKRKGVPMKIERIERLH
jgi:ribosomal protein L18E